MSLSNKKIKAIKNAISTKSIQQLSSEFGISESEIQKILDVETMPKKEPLTDQKPNNSLIHTILVCIIGLAILSAPLWNGDATHYDFANLMQEIFIQTASVFALTIWLIDCLISGKFQIKKSIFYWPILAILVWAYLSLTWSTNQPESMATILQWSASAIFFFVLFQMIQTPTDAKIIFYSIFLTSAWLIYIGLDQFLDDSSSTYNQVIKPSGTFGNKNMLCDYLTITIPLCFYLFLSQFEKFKKTQLVIGSLVYTAGVLLIVFSFTRAGFVNVPIVLGFFFISAFLLFKKTNLQPFFRKERIILIAVSIAIFCISMGFLMNSNKSGFQWQDYKKRVESIFLKTLNKHDAKMISTKVDDKELAPISDSTGIRIVTWLNTMAMIKDRPVLGYGLNNWQIHYADYRNSVRNDPTYQPGLILAQMHNDYIQTAVELGLVGLFLFFILSGVTFWQAWKILKTLEVDYEAKRMTLTIMLCLAGFSIACFFSFLMVKAIPTLLFCVYLAMIASIYHTNSLKEGIKKNYEIPKAISGFLLILLIPLAIWVTILESNRSEADKAFKMANDSITQQNHAQALSAAKEALKLAPYLKKTYFMLANTYSSLNDYENSEKNIEEALKYYPNDLMGLFQAGTIQVRQLKIELEKPKPDMNQVKTLESKARFWYEKAFKIRNDFSKAWNNLGFIYERKSQRFLEIDTKESELALKEAEKCFDNALKQDFYYTDAALNKANILLITHREVEATEIAIKILNFLSKRYTDAEAKVAELIQKNYQKNSGVYFDALKQRLTASSEFISSTPKAIQIIRYGVSISKDYASLLPVYENEEKYLNAQFREQAMRTQNSEDQYETAKQNPNTIRTGITLELLKSSYEVELRKLEQLKAEAPLKLLKLKSDKLDIYRRIDKGQEFVNTAEQLIKDAEIFRQPEYVASTKIKLADFYLNSPSADTKSKLPLIRKYLDEALPQNSLFIKLKNILEEQYKNIVSKQ